MRRIDATKLLLAASKNGTACDEYLLQMFFALVPTEVSSKAWFQYHSMPNGH